MAPVFQMTMPHTTIPSRIKRLIAVIAALAVFSCASFPSHAATYTAKISNILLYEDGDLVYVYLEGGTQQRPACAGSNGDYLSFSMKRRRAKEYLAGLLLAFQAKKTVMFRTEGACVDQAVSDTLTYFMINND